MQNTICWTDIPVLDLDRAIAFYSAVLGAEVIKEGGPGFSFGLLPHGDNNVSGCLYVGENDKPSATGPLLYLNAAGRLDDAIAAVTAHGGVVVQEKTKIGPHGFRAVFLDTEGNRLALHSPTE